MTLTEVLRAAAEVPFNPDDSIDLAGLLIVGLPATIAAVGTAIVGFLTVRGQKRGRERWQEDRELIGDIHRQAVNDHPRGPNSPNMRDQFDRMEAAQQRMEAAQEIANERIDEIGQRQVAHGRDIRGIRTDVGELRGADRTAQAEHDDLVRRLNGFIRREHPDADPL